MFCIAIYIFTVGIIQAIKCDELTEMQRLKEMPKNVILKFKDC